MYGSKREKMKFSKIILPIAISMFSTMTLSYANKAIVKPFAKEQQLNPGLDAQVQVVSMKADKNLTYTIVKLPRNGTLYYDAEKITDVGAVIKDPNKLTVDPKDGDVTVVFEYTTTDQNGTVSDVKTVIIPFRGLKVSGAAFHDFDGNGVVDGEQIFELDGKKLYISLVDHKEKVLSSKPLNREGTFHFDNSDGLQPYSNYALIITTKKSGLRSVLPVKWGHSGESIHSVSTKKDKYRDGIVVVSLKDKNIEQIHFGLDIRPVAKNITQLTQLNPGSDSRVVVPKLEGSDSENGAKIRFMISDLPQNATLYDNGKKISKKNVEIKDPSRLTVDPDNGDQIVKITYVTADKVGVVSHPATITMPFAGLSISGQVYNDGDGDAMVNGKPISYIGDEPLYATLLNEKRIILASTSIASNGSYLFDGTNHIVPNRKYYVIISTEPLASTSSLPNGWNNAGDGVMDAETGNDGNNDGMVLVDVSIKDVKNVDFSMNHKASADNITIEEQLNPGDMIRVAVPALKGSDDESSKKLIYTIHELPKNATLYYNGKKIIKENFIVPDPRKLTIDPENGEQKIQFSYTVTDEADIVSDPATVSMAFKELKLSGYIFNDGDGDSNVNGDVLYEADGTQLHVLLLTTEQKVLSGKAVGKDGSYVFTGKDGVKPNTKFFMILATSSDKNHFGLPEGWNNTGENINSYASGKDTASDGVIALNVAKSDITNIDFGINQKPKAKSQKIDSQLNPGLDIRVHIPTLTGNDRESDTELIYRIESLPTLGTLYYDGIKVEDKHFIIKETDKLSIDPDNGDKVVLFTFSTKDQAGVLSDPARVELHFKGLSVSGHVVNDGNGDTKVEGAALYNPENTPLYVTLLNENFSVLASKILHEDASYHFSSEDGIRPNAYYSIVLSTKENAKTSVLPDAWANSGEVINSKGESKDLTVDGMIVLHVVEKDIPNIDFGINKKPLAESKTAETQVNPGGSQTVSVPSLSGSDEESGSDLRYMIKEISKNATLYNGKEKVSNFDFVDPNSLYLDPKDGKQTAIISYVSIDHEGTQSKPATITMFFTGLSISGSIFEDFVVDGNVDGATTIAADKAVLYITLLNAAGEVLATVPTSKEGTYLLDQTTGVNAHTKYTLVLSKDENATTSILPEGWHYVDGENVNSLGKGNDGKADGIINIFVKDIDLKQVDFGINYLIQ